MYTNTRKLAVSALIIAGTATAIPSRGANYPAKLLGAQTPNKYMLHQARKAPTAEPEPRMDNDISEIMASLNIKDKIDAAADISALTSSTPAKGFKDSEAATATTNPTTKDEHANAPRRNDMLLDFIINGQGIALSEDIPEPVSEESNISRREPQPFCTYCNALPIPQLKCTEFQFSNSATCVKSYRKACHPRRFNIRGLFTNYNCEPAEEGLEYDYFCRRHPPDQQHPYGKFEQFPSKKQWIGDYCIDDAINKYQGYGWCGRLDLDRVALASQCEDDIV